MAERAGDVIDRIGMGHFQHKLLWACGASWATDAMEVLLIGFAIPSLIADWSLSPQPSARGTGMGWAGGVARIAGVLAPLIGAYLIGLDLAIALGFYALAFAAAAIVVFVAGQETMNQPLAEIEQELPHPG
jgi:MFS family permease